MSDIEFPKGMFFEAPHENAPDFIRGKISINAAKAIPWIQANVNEGGYVNLDVKVSKGGKTYLAKNTFAPNQGRSNQSIPPKQPAMSEDDLNDEIPF